jgi:phosphate:Na+ symporter
MKGWGYVITGLGFFFLGVFFLKTGFDQYEFNLQLFQPDASSTLVIFTYTGIGILATILLQSSAATLAIILTALSVNQIVYQDALALAIGSNIGTTFTALLGSMAANQAGKKLAIAHLIFNIITGLVALIFLSQFRLMVDYITQLAGIGEHNYTLKLATFHSLFNIVGVIIMVPWINLLISILNKIIIETAIEIEKPIYLNKEILNHPQSTIHALYKESEHLLDNTFEILAHSLNVHRTDLLKAEKISDVLKQSTDTIDIDIHEIYMLKIKNIYSKIIKYSSLITIENLTNKEIIALANIRNANRLMVNVIKDLEDFRINLNIFLRSDNEYVRDTYNKFRKRLLRIIKELFLNINRYPYQSDSSMNMPKSLYESDLKIIKANINEQKVKLVNLDNEIMGIISDLLSQKLIKSRIASSIWNDCMSVIRIGQNLLIIMELLYADTVED